MLEDPSINVYSSFYMWPETAERSKKYEEYGKKIKNSTYCRVKKISIKVARGKLHNLDNLKSINDL